MEEKINGIGCFVLCIATFLGWSQLYNKDNVMLKYYAYKSIEICNVYFAFLLIKIVCQFGHFPLSNLYESSIFLVWILILMCQLSDSKIANSEQYRDQYQIKWNRIIIPPTALCIMIFITYTIPIYINRSHFIVPALQANWLIMHVSMMILSYSFLIIGCLLGVAFLMMQIKGNFDLRFFNPNSVISDSFSFKSLHQFEWLETSLFIIRQIYFLNYFDYWSYRLISLGLPFLTMGILAGAIWANDAWGSYWSWDPKETWALITWIVFSLYLHLRMNTNSNPTKSSIIAVLALCITWFCYLGVNLFGQGFHTYGSFGG